MNSNKVIIIFERYGAEKKSIEVDNFVLIYILPERIQSSSLRSR